VIARNPKVIMGYSDLTGLLNAIHTKTGLITFHGYYSYNISDCINN
jgi:muramoyltetrapeptide carboxypeptidase